MQMTRHRSNINTPSCPLDPSSFAAHDLSSPVFQILHPILWRPAQPRAVQPDSPLLAPGQVLPVPEYLVRKNAFRVLPRVLPVPLNRRFQRRALIIIGEISACNLSQKASLAAESADAKETFWSSVTGRQTYVKCY